MATKHSTRTERIDTSDVQGEGSYIVIRRPTLGEHNANRKKVNQFQRKVKRAQKKYDALEKRDDDSDKFYEQLDKAADALDSITEDFEKSGKNFFAFYIIEWNWKNYEGKRMEAPSIDNSVMDDVSDREFQFIVEQFDVSEDTKKN